MKKHEHSDALIEALKPAGAILVIGFEDGSLAEKMQSRHPKSLTLIEEDPGLFEKAKAWADRHKHVSVVLGNWQATLPQLGKFDCIVISEEQKAAHETSHAEKLLQKEKEMNKHVEEQIPHLLSMRYSDEDIDSFLKGIPSAQKKEASFFLSELQARGQISEEQYKHFSQKYHLSQEVLQPAHPEVKHVKPLFPLVMQCLKNHLRSQGRFACVLHEGTSYYQDSAFFEHIITNPHYVYREVPFSGDEGGCTLMLIELV